MTNNCYEEDWWRLFWLCSHEAESFFFPITQHYYYLFLHNFSYRDPLIGASAGDTNESIEIEEWEGALLNMSTGLSFMCSATNVAWELGL